MPTFGFDSERFYNDLVDYIIFLVDDLAKNTFRDIKTDLSPEAKDSVEYDGTFKEIFTDYEGPTSGNEFINARIRAYALAIMDSFGTGLKMDTSSPYLSDYISGNLWNPLRTGPEIVGREEGEYTNIFGEKVRSKGKYAGKPLSISFNKNPTRAIQHQEDWLIKNGETKLERTIKTFVEEFIANNAYKYFRNGGKK